MAKNEKDKVPSKGKPPRPPASSKSSDPKRGRSASKKYSRDLIGSALSGPDESEVKATESERDSGGLVYPMPDIPLPSFSKALTSEILANIPEFNNIPLGSEIPGFNTIHWRYESSETEEWPDPEEVESEPYVPTQPSTPERNHPENAGAGMKNLGNTCYLNSVLQCLIHTVPLLNAILSEEHQCNCKTYKGEPCLLWILCGLVKDAFSSTFQIIEPLGLVNNLSYFSSNFIRYQQEDAHEFLQSFLNRLENCYVTRRINNFVEKMVGGFLLSKLTCSNCGHPSDKKERSVDLSLEIGDADDLLTAIQSFMKVEKIEDMKHKCENCKEQVSINKQFVIDEVRSVEIFHLKRFKTTGSLVEKINKHVAFPLELDLLPFTVVGKQIDLELKYVLYAIVVHRGLEFSSGHYYCFIRLFPDMWCRFDDTEIGTLAGFNSAIEFHNLFEDSTISNEEVEPNPHVPIPLSMSECRNPVKTGAGMKNLGYTGYINSVLQCFIHTVPLLNAIFSEAHQCNYNTNEEEYCLPSIVRGLVKNSFSSTEKEVIEPWDIVGNLSYFSSNYLRHQQEDAHEFLQYFLNRLEEFYLSRQINNFVEEVFGGILFSKLKCCNCGHCSNAEERSVDLSLEIGDADDLLTAIQSFMKVEKIEDKKYKCENCKQKVSIEKQFVFNRVPSVAIFHLKRFKTVGSLAQKIDKHVAFPLELDLTPFTGIGKPTDLEYKYVLYAIIVHLGPQVSSGHYYCYIRLSSDMWCSFDDDMVVLVPEDDVLSQEAYILFYAEEDTCWFTSAIETCKLFQDSTVSDEEVPIPLAILPPISEEQTGVDDENEIPIPLAILPPISEEQMGIDDEEGELYDVQLKDEVSLYLLGAEEYGIKNDELYEVPLQEVVSFDKVEPRLNVTETPPPSKVSPKKRLILKLPKSEGSKDGKKSKKSKID